MPLTNTELKRIGRRIRERRAELGMTQPELASLVSLSTPSVSKYENGKVSEASYGTLSSFAEALYLTPEELLDMRGAESVRRDEAGTPAAKAIPVIGKAAAGAPLFAVDEYDEHVFVDKTENVDFAVKVRGDSMINARIHDGDLVFAKRQPTVSNGEIAIVALDEGMDESYVTTKRFYRYGDTIVLRSENPKYADIEITKRSGKSVRIVGKVIFLKAYVR